MGKSTGQPGKSRNSAGQYSPGTSGNPAGRPASPVELRDAAACYTVEAVQMLGEILRDERQATSTRARAAQTLLRVGRPAAEPPPAEPVPHIGGQLFSSVQEYERQQWEREQRARKSGQWQAR